MQNDGRSEIVQKAIQQIRGVKENDNLFQVLYQRGEGMTFNDQGDPFIYKQTKARPEVYQQAVYSFNKSASTTIKKSYTNMEIADPHFMNNAITIDRPLAP